MAADISKVLGKLTKSETCYENDQYVVSWALGHLVGLFMPEDIDPKLKTWSISTLPIIPKKFGIKPIEKTKKRFNELKRLIKREDVEELINACDAGREGELIFTYIYDAVKCKKPFKRLWLSSMTASGIKEAFSALKNSEDMQNLQDAAKCRSEADWLIGINCTRAITRRMFSARAKQIATVGRVQTPTLAMIVKRDNEIANFVPVKYWRIVGQFGLHDGQYQGVFQRSDKLNAKDPNDRIDRIWDKKFADELLTAISAEKSAIVTDKKKRTTQSAPRLYDLTTLQREANSRYSLPAGKTLNIAQSLYERHKCLTYPRTDSRALTEDYGPTCYQILGMIGGENERFAKHVIDNKLVNTANKKIFNNKQVTDHFAIIPTAHPPKSLSEDEGKIYNMVVKRFIAVFYPDAEFDVTTRTSVVKDDYVFKTEGKVLVSPGWMEVYGKAGAQDSTLPAISAQDGEPAHASVLEVSAHEEETRPAAPYNEATLLAAMEGAGKLLEDDDLAAAMKERGLGTPATRAQIIEHLLNLHYIERDKRDLHSTGKAEDLMSFLKMLNIETLADPVLTGDWEYKLRQMEGGEFARETFMTDIEDLTKRLIKKVQDYDESSFPLAESSIISPIDGKPLLESFRAYKTADSAISVPKSLCGRKFSAEEIVDLLKNKRIGPLEGFQSKRGLGFSANVIIKDDNTVGFEFTSEPAVKASEEEIESYEEVCKCPLCGAPVLSSPDAYICKSYFDKKCNFRVAKRMLEREIPVEQLLKLANDKSTDMLEGFKSKRTGKLFNAKLVLRSGGKIGFVFK